MDVGTISINLTMEDGQFRYQVSNASGLLKTLRQDFVRTADSIDHIGRKFNGFGGNLIYAVHQIQAVRYALIDFRDVFLTLPVSILKTSGEIERLTKLMEGLSKETGKAAKEQEALRNTQYIFDMAKTAPFEVKALSDAFVKFKSAGLDPTDGSLKALTDSVARFGGTSQQLHRASIAIQQMAGKGVISMEELRQQLGEAVPTAMQMMAIGVGMSMADLVRVISKGQVESKEALSRMFAVMRAENDGAAAAMMETWTGSIERLKTTWELAKLEMGRGGMFETAKAEINKLIDSFDGTQMRTFMTDIGYLTAEGAKGFAAMIQFVRDFYDELKTAGGVMLAVFASSKILGAAQAVAGRIATEYKAGISAIMAADKQRFDDETKYNHERKQRHHIRLIDLAEEKAHSQKTYADLNSHYNDMLNERKNMVRAMNGFQRAETVAVMRAQIAAYDAELASVKASALEHRGRAVALEAEIAATRANIAALESQVIAQNQVTATAKVWAGMKGMLGGIWMALGGWIGVATAALAAGVMAWMDYATAAERASQRAANAARGISDAAALKQTEADLKKLRGTVDSLELEKAGKLGGFSGDGTTWTAEDEARLNAEKAKIVEKERELSNEIDMHRSNLAADERTRYIEGAKRLQNERMRAITNGWQSAKDVEVSEMTKARKAIEDAYAGNEKAKAEALKVFDAKHAKELSEATRRNELQRLTSQREFLKDQNRQIEEDMKKATGNRLQAMKDLVAQNNEQIADLEKNLIPGANKIGTPTTLLNAKGDKAKKENTEAEAWLARVHAKIISINAEMNKEGTGSIAKLLIADLDKIGDAKLEKDRKSIEKALGLVPGQKDLRGAITQAVLPELLKAEDIKRLEEFDGLWKNITDQLGEADVALKGGVSGVEKLRTAVLDLGAANPDDEALMKRVRQALDGLDELERRKSALNFRDLSADLKQATETVTASLSDDPKESLYAKWAKDIETYSKKLQDSKLSAEDAKKAQDQLHEYALARTERLVRDLETPMQKLARQWQNVTDDMDKASTKWANGFLDAMVELTTTGKTDFNKLLMGMLQDFQRMNLQKQFGGTITEMFEGISGWAKGLLGGDGQKATQASDELVSSFKAVGITSDTVAATLKRMSKDGVDATTASLIQQVGSANSKLLSEAAATTSLNALALAAQNAAGALTGNSGGGLLGTGALASMAAQVGGFESLDYAGYNAVADFIDPFAEGGIMTKYGPAALKKYAAGGIANSPQISLFGEAGPEAYVPLPDGRSIPVTLKGDSQPAGANVTINLINNSGQPVNAQQGDLRFDGRQMILDVVLSAASQPGPFRSAMKGAMGA